MKALVVSFLTTVSLLVLAACNDGGGSTGGPSSSGFNLSGSWSGRYQSPDMQLALTAKIRQDGDTLIIQTTKEGVGHLLTGTISTNGSIMLTDSLDGETWTSYGEVTDVYVRIRDYLYNPALGSDQPEQDIYLSR